MCEKILYPSQYPYSYMESGIFLENIRECLRVFWIYYNLDFSGDQWHRTELHNLENIYNLFFPIWILSKRWKLCT